MTIKVDFLSHYRKAQCEPNPNYPDGIAVDLSEGAGKTCTGALPYPAECCGVLIARCSVCGANAAVTTAGRPAAQSSITTSWISPSRTRDRGIAGFASLTGNSSGSAPPSHSHPRRAPVSDLLNKVAKAICQEECAYRGEPA